MQVFIINLDRQTERMAFQTGQLNTLGMKFKRIPAIEIQDDEDPKYTQYFKTWKQFMSKSEVACFLSHLKVWELVMADKSPALVLEDDAWLADPIKEVLNQVKSLKKIDYINLEVREKRKRRLLAKHNTYTLGDTKLFRLYQGRSGAAGYILWPSGAAKLHYKAMKGRIALADKFINSCYELQAYQADPALIVQLDQCKSYRLTPPLECKTTISRLMPANLKTTTRINLRRKRLVEEVKIGLNFLTHSFKTQKRSVNLSKYFKPPN